MKLKRLEQMCLKSLIKSVRRKAQALDMFKLQQGMKISKLYNLLMNKERSAKS